MAHDLIIRGGLIVDGTGSEPYLGDVAIDKDTIVAMGVVEGTGLREIDAKGHAVTPGFVEDRANKPQFPKIGQVR